MALADSDRPHLFVHGLTSSSEEEAVRGLLATAASHARKQFEDGSVVKERKARSRDKISKNAEFGGATQNNVAEGNTASAQHRRSSGGKAGRAKNAGIMSVAGTPSSSAAAGSGALATQPIAAKECVAFQANSTSEDAEFLPPLPELVHRKLLRPLTEVLRINSLTRIQRLSWKPVMDRGRDVLIRSETGSGKTLAYALPLLHQLLCDCDSRPLQRQFGSVIIVLCPVRELAMQVTDVLTTLTRCALFLTVGGIHGGENRHKEKARLRKGITILVTTPGRLLDHLKATSSFRVENTQTIVLDEADRLLDMGFEHTIREVMELLVAKRNAVAHASGDGGQSFKRVLVSATITAAVERLSHFALRENVIRVGETEDTFSVPSSLRQHYVTVPAKHRLATLISFLRSQLDAGAKRVIVFVSTSDSAEFHYYLLSRLRSPFFAGTTGGRTAQKPSQHRYSLKRRIGEANRHIYEDPGEEVVSFDDDSEEDNSAEPNALSEVHAMLDVNIFKLHGNMSQVDRASVFHSFKHLDDGAKGSAKGILFCTDVAARGLDMPNVDWIIHYDPPTDPACYIHRIGRTARIGNGGDSMLFLMPQEVGYASYISNFMNTEGSVESAGGEGRRKVASVMEEKKYESFLFYLTKLDPKSNHMWIQSTATLERAICRLVMKRHPTLENSGDDETLGRNDDITRLALFAYQSYIRAYAGHSRELKRLFFCSDLLHLGHVAQSFGIDKRPTEVRSQLQGFIREDRKLSRRPLSVAAGENDERPRKVPKLEMSHNDRYRSTVVQKQRKVTKDWYEKKRAETPAQRHQQFTEFDA